MRPANVFISAVLIFFQAVIVHTNRKTPEQACAALMTESVMKVSCAQPLNQYINNIRSCRKQHPGKLTCQFGECVVTKKYGINGCRKDSVSYPKAYALLDRLDIQQPATTHMNELVRECCLCNYNYLNYPQLVPNCRSLQYMTCALFGYLMGQNTTSASYLRRKPGCYQTAQNVLSCKSVLHKFCPCLNRRYKY